jgi:NitT/TauT family transport system permease protein
VLAVSLVLLALWEFAGRSGVFGERSFPPISRVLAGVPYVITSDTANFGHHVGITVTEFLTAFAIALGLGVVLGAIVALVPRLGRAAMPLFVVWEVIPKVAVVPLIIVALGYGQASTIAVGAMLGFFPIFLNTHRGLTSVDEKALALLGSLGAGRWQRFRYYLFPNALPAMWAGVKVGLSFTIIGTILGEFLTLQEGVGFSINAYRQQLRMDLAYAVTIMVAAFGVALYFLMEALERVVIPWFDSETLT